MDAKRKRLYIIIIAICVVLSAVILWWGKRSPSVDTAPIIPPSTSTNATQSADGSFNPPPVFPSSTQFDLQVLQSSDFKKLNTFSPLSVNPADVGRDDPFKNY